MTSACRLLTALAAFLITTTAAFAQSFDARVIGVSDGDTITVLHDNQPEKFAWH